MKLWKKNNIRGLGELLECPYYNSVFLIFAERKVSENLTFFTLCISLIGQNSNADNNVNRNFEFPDFIHSCSLVVYCGLWLKIRYFASFFQHPVRTPNARTHTNKNYINWLISWIRLEQTNIKSCITTVRFLCNIITFYIFFLCGLGFTKFTDSTAYMEFTMACLQAWN